MHIRKSSWIKPDSRNHMTKSINHDWKFVALQHIVKLFSKNNRILLVNTGNSSKIWAYLKSNINI